jgi:hypothetical protein
MPLLLLLDALVLLAILAGGLPGRSLPLRGEEDPSGAGGAAAPSCRE